jgi:hypothetical protein
MAGEKPGIDSRGNSFLIMAIVLKAARVGRAGGVVNLVSSTKPGGQPRITALNLYFAEVEW